MEQIVDTLAILHGTCLDPDCTLDTGWLRSYEDFFRAAARGGIQAGHDQAMEAAADVIPDGVLARKAQIWPAAERALAMHLTGECTVIHSDVHLGNWYITRDGRMGLSDWARVCTGHWGRDLAYALMTTLSVSHRRAWERDLIERYCARQSEVAGRRLSFEAAWTAYRRQAPAALLMWTPTLCPPPTLPDMQPEATSRLMIERITAAMDDLNVLDGSMTMQDEAHSRAQFGAAVLEEVIVRAGLQHARAQTATEPLQVSLEFLLSTDAEAPAVLVRLPRTGQEPLELRIELD